MRSGWKTSSASSFSPVDANLIGLPVTALTLSAAPPRASPSSFVRTTPSKAMRSSKACATLTASWPVIASTTSRTLSGFASSRTRSSSSISSSSICSRPAVSTITVSRPSLRARSRPLRVASTASFVSRAVDGHLDLLAELLELVDRGGALQVGGDEARLAALLAQVQRELAGGRRLARALQAGEQDDRELPERETGLALAHQLRQLVVDDLHDLLAGRQALEDLLAERPLADGGDEVAHDREVDVRLEQREADLAHRTRDRLLVELALLAQVAEGALQLVGEAVEHSRGW